MKQFLLILFLATTGFLSKGQTIVYDENAEVRTVESFSGVEVSGTVSLYISKGTTQGVAISAGDAKYNGKIKTEVKNGILNISVDGGLWNGFNWENKKLKAYVTVATLSSLEASGASFVSMAGTITSENLKIEMSGASELKGDIEAKTFSLSVSGASVVKLSGKASDAHIDASGACTISAYNLVTDNCNVSSSGASGVRIFVKNQLIAEASGGSSVSYKGKPATVNVHGSAGSSIKNKGED